MTPAHLDTSVIVRYLVGDDPALAAQAKSLVESADELVINPVALAESAHVLRSVYGVAREPLVDALIQLVNRKNIAIRGLSREIVILALRRCRPSGRVSVPDALIWAAAMEDHASGILTFDRRFPDLTLSPDTEH
ncbi:MAG: PIN domain-containing protein [Armatimonadota bacterium]